MVKGIMFCNELDYPQLTFEQKQKRVDVFAWLGRKLDSNKLKPKTAEYVAEFIDDNLLYEDIKRMSYEDLLILRGQGYVDNPEIMELYPEEFAVIDPYELEFA